jgi:tRNA (guanine10-N2)-methyltransferase
MHEHNRENAHKWSAYAQDTSFKFFVKAFNHTLPQSRQRDIIESFSYMMLLGKIDMKNPEITFGCFENCRSMLSPFPVPDFLRA